MGLTDRNEGDMGRRAYGWNDDDSWIIESEARVLRQAAADLTAPEPDRKSMRQIVRELNDAGILTGYNSAWTIQSLKRMLINPRMIGRKNNSLGHVVMRGPLVCPPILPVEDWFKVRAQISKNSKNRAPNNPEPAEWTGYLQCDNCGEQLFPQRPRERTARYACHTGTGCGNNAVRAHLFEPWAAQQLVAHAAEQLAFMGSDMTALEVAAWWTRADLAQRRVLIGDHIERIEVRNTSRPGWTELDPDRFTIVWLTTPKWEALNACA
jgi:hypothetical protein